MKTKHRRSKRGRKTQKKYHKTSGKKWQTAIEVAQDTLKKTGSLKKANLALKKQALFNARKLFGSV
jgi:hypothetical protein